MRFQAKLAILCLSLVLVAPFSWTQESGKGNENNKLDDVSDLVSETSNLDSVDDPALAEGILSRKREPVVNTIGSRTFVETYSSRCGHPTKVDLPPEEVPKMILLRNGEPEADVHIKFEADDEEFLKAGFDPEKHTTIFVHGWTQSPRSRYMKETRRLIAAELKVAERANYMIFDWGVASRGTYPVISAKISGVANYLAVFMEKLIALGNDRLKIHLVGHSVGVPLTAFAGRRISPPIGRITALDPAGPCFGLFFGSNGPDDRLIRNDAHSVIIYHYDKLIGLPHELGDIDIFVNGGHNQPGCPKTMRTAVEAIISQMTGRNQATSPSHTRASMVSTRSLQWDQCEQVAYECEDRDTFLAGKCADCGAGNERCFLMSFPFQYAEQSSEQPLRHELGPKGKRMFIEMGLNDRFCSNHYQIVVELEASGQPKGKHPSEFRLDLVYELASGEKKIANLKLKDRLDGSRYSTLLVTDEEPIRVISAKLRAYGIMHMQLGLAGGKVSGSADDLKVKQVAVNFMSNLKPEVRAKLSARLCPTSLVVDRLALDVC